MEVFFGGSTEVVGGSGSTEAAWLTGGAAGEIGGGSGATGALARTTEGRRAFGAPLEGLEPDSGDGTGDGIGVAIGGAIGDGAGDGAGR